MSTPEIHCEQCGKTTFPEGILLYWCPACQGYVHRGCWEGHVSATHPGAGDVVPKPGCMGAYGLIKWQDSGSSEIADKK